MRTIEFIELFVDVCGWSVCQRDNADEADLMVYR